jgi:hypothetical protein
MSRFLLVDDSDGRVLADVRSGVAVLRALERLDREHPELTETLCLVRFDGGRGVLLGTETTTRLRSLT